MTAPFCDDCTKVVKHPLVRSFAHNHHLVWRTDHARRLTIKYIGTIKTIAGVAAYVSKPAGGYAKGKAVLIVTGERGSPQHLHCQ